MSASSGAALLLCSGIGISHDIMAVISALFRVLRFSDISRQLLHQISSIAQLTASDGAKIGICYM